MSTEALEITVSGIVQGVGYRPFVFRIAHEMGVAGWILNDIEGVLIHAEGTTETLDAFVVRLSSEEPPAAQVSEISMREVAPQGYQDFTIQLSEDQETDNTTLISPDLGTCDACAVELFDPENRRYRYPFINCTNCGPRFTILNSLPYDRANTSMAGFTMCPECAAEYENPFDRRFHAQPDACFTCGPELGWITAEELTGEQPITWAHDRKSSDALIAQCVELLSAGGIVAVKGLGGYHLVCDAANPHALSTLRERKAREGKPFAVMVSSLDDARIYCEVSDDEAAYLQSAARPIVLLRKKAAVLASEAGMPVTDAPSLASGLADGVHELGVMLPATPVQMLLAHDFGGMLVMTSGNVHDNPICITEEEAFAELRYVADAFLVNNRAIVARYDDSVLRLVRLPEGSMVQFVRRARGYAPTALSIPAAFDGAQEDGSVQGDAGAQEGNAYKNILAVGSQQKNTFTLTRDAAEAFVSQHLGDVENAAVLDAWEEARVRYEELFRVTPDAIALDMHPDYILSKQYRDAVERADVTGYADTAERADADDRADTTATAPLPLIEVQHHYAHILSVMGEHGLMPPVVGFSFDGTGYGMDGAIWGGEVLLANYETFERFANIAYFPLPGGAAAVKDPRRSAYGVLWAYDLLETPAGERFVASLEPQLQEALAMQVERGVNAPMTSSMGRLFDAVSALTGICEQATYDGQPAIMLETAVHAGITDESIATYLDTHPDASAPYEFALIKNVGVEGATAQEVSVILMDPEPVLAAILSDLGTGVPANLIAKKFHDAVINLVVMMAQLAISALTVDTVVLSGGVFMNRYLAEGVIEALTAAGIAVALNVELPPNDGNISYGQAVLGLQQKPQQTLQKD